MTKKRSFIQKAICWLFGLTVIGLVINFGFAVYSRDLPISAVTYCHPYAIDVGLALFYLILSFLVFLVALFAHRIFTKGGLAKTIMVAVSVIIALVLFELALIPFNLVFNSGHTFEFNFKQAMVQAAKNPQQKDEWKSKVQWWAMDDELSYKPLMGPDYPYSKYGALHNDYAFEKPVGTTRVVFLGDSIAALGFLTNNVRELMKRPDYEYWTLGVYGYSTNQEIGYFKRYGLPLKPDIVILEFCLNDWDGTPVILKNDNGYTVIANTYLGQEHFNYWLFKHSTLYRVYLSLKASFTDRAGLKDDVAANLQKLADMGREHGYEFRVVVYPELDKKDKWPPKIIQEHTDIVEILQKLGIPYYDAAPMLEAELVDKPRDWSRFEKNDHFHPSKPFSRMIAEQIINKGFLNR